jgi:hypothetical protein
MLFLHLKSGHVYEYVGLTIIEATMEPAVIYCSPGFPESTFTRPASVFFDGRFVPFIPAASALKGDVHGNLIEDEGEVERPRHGAN